GEGIRRRTVTGGQTGTRPTPQRKSWHARQGTAPQGARVMRPPARTGGPLATFGEDGHIVTEGELVSQNFRVQAGPAVIVQVVNRSEERRVGKEGRPAGWGSGL